MVKLTSHSHPMSNLMRGVVMRTDNVLLRCSHCGRLRVSPNQWEHVLAPSEAELVMVVCPDCAEALSARYRLNPPTHDVSDLDID